MSQTPQNPAVNPPVDGDPRNLATTPDTLENYDVVIDGQGYMIWRALAGPMDPPSMHFKTEPADLTMTDVFVPRTNVSGDFGDNQQDFFLSFVQRDWSGGQGQKYFRQQPDRERMYWDGKNVVPTLEPGQVTMGPPEIVNGQTPNVDPNKWMNMVYAAETGSGGDTSGTNNSVGDALFRVSGTAVSTVLSEYSIDGGVTWTTQSQSSGQIWKDCVDIIAADNGVIYCLEANHNAGSKIHHGAFPQNTSTPWVNEAALAESCNNIEYYNSAIYVSSQSAKLRKVTGLGGTIVEVTITDFGTGTIIDLLSAGGYLWVLYFSPLGDYRLYQYDGATVTEAARLPRGWKMQKETESTYPLQGTGISVAGNVQTKISIACMCFQDGVLYITGMTPTKDYLQSNRATCAYRTALWYFASGNTGLIWEGEVTTQDWRAAGGGGAICAIQGGIIVFTDNMDNRLMAYDPDTAGVFCVSSCTPQANTPGVSMSLTTSINTTTTSLVVTNPEEVGDVITWSGKTEKMLVTGISNSTNITVIRGYGNTTPQSVTNGTTGTVTMPAPPVARLEYDFSNHVLQAVWSKAYEPADTNLWRANWVNNSTHWPFRNPYASTNNATIITSDFDFDSSLPKYYRSILYDGLLDQVGSNWPGYTSLSGVVRLYYKLNGVANSTTDSGVVQITGGTTTMVVNGTTYTNVCLPGTYYDIKQSARNICVIAELIAPSGGSLTATQVSLGPALQRLAVRGIAAQTPFRQRLWAFDLTNKVQLVDNRFETKTPAQLRTTLEATQIKATPVTVSDSTGTMLMSFDSSGGVNGGVLFREVRRNEWVAFVRMREV